MKNILFGTSYKSFDPVHFPTVEDSNLVIFCDWFSEFIGDWRGKVCDCCIPEIFADDTEITKVYARGPQGVITEEKDNISR